MLARRQRRSEEGQTLILAVAFLALFSVFAASVLNFASAVQAQRSSTERTALIDSVTEGSAQFALAATGVQLCTLNSTPGLQGGTMNFQSGDVLKFSVPANSCTVSSTTVPGENCSLCILATDGLSVHNVALSVQGEADLNGDASVSGSSSSPGTFTAGQGIYLFGSGASCGGSHGTCSPPPSPLPTQVNDPLANLLPIPRAGTASPVTSTICPGTYGNIDVSGGSTVAMLPWGTAPCAASTAPSVFVVTGRIKTSGGGSLVANGSTIYFAPGATLNTSGNGDLAVDCGGPPAPAVCVPSPPASGPYEGIALFFDPLNTTSISLQGNGVNEVAGSWEASGASMDIGGGPAGFENGRLILSGLNVHVSTGVGLALTGTIAASSCTISNDILPNSESGQPSPNAGYVRFESGCHSGTGIINFAYGP